MASNPNPARVSAALWYFAECCLAMQPGTRNGGTMADKPGYHNSRDNLIGQGRTGDYSLRYGPDKLGPSDKSAAFDWTFPDAQRGEYGTIIKYGARVREAHRTNDPRAYGFREVLIQADLDGDAEGYDFYLDSTRTPDSSHLWHGHFSVLRQFLNDFNAMNGMLSILAGESLETWRAGRSRYGGTGVAPVGTGDRMFVVTFKPGGTPDTTKWSWWVSNGVQRRTASAWWVVEEWRKVTGRPDFVITDEPSLTALAGPMAQDGDSDGDPIPVEVDATAVADALASNAEFLSAIATAVADENARRQQS